MSAWMDWIREAALSRIDTVERDLRAHPERSPNCTRRWTKPKRTPTRS